MTLKIHHLQMSQSERIVWLAEELGIEYELVYHPRDPFLAPQSIRDLHPLGQAPIIQDGPVTLPESAAIADYMLQKYGSDSGLALGPSDADFAQYLHWFHFATGNMHPQATRVMVLQHCEVDMSGWHAQRHVKQYAKFLKFVDDRVKDNEWLAGARFTAADVMNIFSLTTMRAFTGQDLSDYPNILSYLKRVSEREAYQRARARADPGVPLMIDGPPPPSFFDKIEAAGKK
ncbi:putative glutathione S-transferase [Nemania sp. NC0429]|nr:putative glutathione S-transferase [Nemania sp. NC0429]